MTRADLADLLLLAALWGASFLFMRIAAPEFGPVALIAVRCALAALCLSPLLLLRGHRPGRALRAGAGALVVVGLLGSALPFTLLAWSTLALGSGFVSILNATAPLWTAVVAALWLRERPSAGQALGLAIGIAGVAVLVGDRVSPDAGAGGAGATAVAAGGAAAGAAAGAAVAAALLATLSYGISGIYAKRRLAGVEPMVAATGSQLGATLWLALPAALAWPATPVSGTAWAAAVALAVGCTGVAYVLYFRLIARCGPTRAMTVTFLIPLFGVMWGAVVLGEAVDARTVAAGAVILAGTALSTGLLRLPLRRPQRPGATP